MIKFSGEKRHYLEEYRKSIEESNDENKDLYLYVLERAYKYGDQLCLLDNEQEFMDLVSKGNLFVIENLDALRNDTYRTTREVLKKKLDKHIFDAAQQVAFNPNALAPATEEIDPEEAVEREDMIEASFEALEKLDEKRRTIIERLVLHPEPITKLEKELHMDHGTIRRKEESGMFKIAMSPRVAYYRFAEDEFMTRLVEDKEERDKPKMVMEFGARRSENPEQEKFDGSVELTPERRELLDKMPIIEIPLSSTLRDYEMIYGGFHQVQLEDDPTSTKKLSQFIKPIKK